MSKEHRNKLIITWIFTIAIYIMCLNYGIKYNATKNELLIVENDLKITNENVLLCMDDNKTLSEQLSVANKTIADLSVDEYDLIYLGEFTITHYCGEKFEHICGLGKGITATGAVATTGRTVAVDKNAIPYGTDVYIEGYGWRVAEDCGEAVVGNRIDVLVDTHEEALDMGVVNKNVWILIKRS